MCVCVYVYARGEGGEEMSLFSFRVCLRRRRRERFEIYTVREVLNYIQTFWNTTEETLRERAEQREKRTRREACFLVFLCP